MTTPNTDLAEQIEASLLEVLGAIEEQGYKTVWLAEKFIDPADLSAAVLPIVEQAVKRGQAEAWEESKKAWLMTFVRKDENGHYRVPPNPYRATEYEQEKR